MHVPYRLNDDFITTDPANRDFILTVDTQLRNTNNSFSWYFQDFEEIKTGRNIGRAPLERQVSKLRVKLCKKPEDVDPKDYKFNFNNDKVNEMGKLCRIKANNQVGLRNTRSYFAEVLEAVGSEFALGIKDEFKGGY